KYHLGPVYTPPTVSKLEGPLGTLTMGTASGGTNWPGGSYDPETHVVYVYACNSCIEPIGLVPAPKDISDLNYIAGVAGRDVQITGAHRRGGMLRAYDKATGKEVGAVYMPAPESGSPMTYMIHGKQYIVVAVSGGPYSGEYIAYTLPSAGE